MTVNVGVSPSQLSSSEIIFEVFQRMMISVPEAERYYNTDRLTDSHQTDDSKTAQKSLYIFVVSVPTVVCTLKSKKPLKTKKNL